MFLISVHYVNFQKIKIQFSRSFIALLAVASIETTFGFWSDTMTSNMRYTAF